jgi:hypothetical protein
LCAEAQLVLRAAGEPVASNAPVPGVRKLPPAGERAGNAVHTIVDLGADEYTQGRPHPMIEPAIRHAPLSAAVADADTAVVLLDVVLGYGAHPDPAGVLVQGLDDAAPPASRPRVIASVTGTEADPQGYSRQVRTLEQAGIIVAPSNAHAAELALRALRA